MIIKSKVHAVLSLIMVVALTAVIGVGSIFSNRESRAATVPAPVSSLTIRADFVSYLYRCMLQREPDQAGVDFWVGTMATDPDPVNHLYYAFYDSGDFNKAISDTEFSTKMYQCLLFRNPADAPDFNNSGRDFWANELTSGRQTQRSLLKVFLDSDEYNQKIFPKLKALPLNKPAIITAPVNISLSASKTSVAKGETVYLSWGVANATTKKISFNQGIGTVADSGNLAVKPSETTTYTLTASNLVGSASKSVTVVVTNSTTPGLAVVSPAGGETWPVGSTRTISWAKSGGSSSSTVSIFLTPYFSCLSSTPACTTNSQAAAYKIAERVTNNGSYFWTIPSNLSATYRGQVVISIVADNGEAEAVSKPFAINASTVADITPPSISITSPAAGATVSGTFTVLVSATDNVGVTGVSYFVDNVGFGGEITTAPFSTTINTTTPSTGDLFENGTHKIYAIARDAAGNRANSIEVSITINNPTQPTNTKPVGYLDSIDINQGAVFGWSYDPDNVASFNEVHFYIDGLDQAHLVGSVVANQARADVNNNLNVSGNHGFSFSIPNFNQYKDGRPHTLYAFGIDLTDNAFNVQLNGSPKTFRIDVVTSQPVPFPTSANSFVQTLYRCILNRAPSDAEQALWVNRFNNDGNIAEIYDNIYGDQSFGQRNLSSADFIHNLYYCVLFRQQDPAITDADGYNFWLGLTENDRPWPETLRAFLVSEEFTQSVVPHLLTFRTPPVASDKLDPRLSVLHGGGSYPKKDGGFMVFGAQDASDLGFQTLELIMAPEMCIRNIQGKAKQGTYQTFDWCDSQSSVPNISPSIGTLSGLAAHERYRSVFNMNFKNYIITTETTNPDRDHTKPEPSDCVAAELFRINAFNIKAECYRNGFSARQLKSLYDDFYGLGRYLLSTYKNTGKTFVILTPNELESHIQTNDVYPDFALNNAISYLNTISDALHAAKNDSAVTGVKLYHGCEFAVMNDDTEAGKKNAVNYVMPRSRCDLYGWESWDYLSHLNGHQAPYITRGLDYYASKAPDSPDFGNKNIFLSEFGLPEHFFDDMEKTVDILNDSIDRALAWGVPYVSYWGLYDNCTDRGTYPTVTEADCTGFWLRKPASDPSQKGELSDIYHRVFVPRKQQ